MSLLSTTIALVLGCSVSTIPANGTRRIRWTVFFVVAFSLAVKALNSVWRKTILRRALVCIVTYAIAFKARVSVALLIANHLAVAAELLADRAWFHDGT
jgi:hypothetical protein